MLPSGKDLLPQTRLLGFHTMGVAAADAVDSAAADSWFAAVSAEEYDGLDYLRKYEEVRRDSRLLLPGARSVVMAAMSYYTGERLKGFAMYAQGDDYHIVMRERLEQLAQYIRENFGGETRVCVDTAPLLERYWAVKAGIGYRGLNSQIIIPGAGSRFFLGAIVTTAEFAPDEPLKQGCCRCRRCVKACPGGAIGIDGSFNPRKCLSYLTIEHRGDLPEGTDLCGNIYGCDACQDVCPHNLNFPVTPVDEFHLRAEYRKLTPEYIAEEMTQEEFSRLFKNSAVKRTKFAGLRRNALHILATRCSGKDNNSGNNAENSVGGNKNL